jgi:hypothetical protein
MRKLSRTIRRLSRTLGVSLLMLGMSGAFVGCASTIRFSISADEQTNKTTPVYVVVRSVDGQTFLAEHYNAVAEKVFQNTPDETILERKIIFPNQTEVIQIEQPESGNLGIYVLFSEPGENWRIPLQAPFPQEVLISLGKNQIRRVQIRR